MEVCFFMCGSFELRRAITTEIVRFLPQQPNSHYWREEFFVLRVSNEENTVQSYGCFPVVLDKEQDRWERERERERERENSIAVFKCWGFESLPLNCGSGLFRFSGFFSGWSKIEAVKQKIQDKCVHLINAVCILRGGGITNTILEMS